ncbi:MAG: tetratricopeptide repeat protein, partial [Anaerolineales bacterium]|nr:tetratricopeptide repeat protein [Anaerolineales bacterium]
MSLTRHLLASLPESLWSEAVRRLRRTPELWALAERDDAVRAAFCSIGHRPELWRPAPLALAAYAARHPEAGTEPERWLQLEGRERLNNAYTKLVDESAELDPLGDSLPAALALRVRGEVTTDWQTIAADAASTPARWRLPLQYLFGLLDDLGDLMPALLEHSPETAALVAPALAANFDAEALLKLVAPLTAGLPTSHTLALIKAFKSIGEVGPARRLAQQAARYQATRQNAAGSAGNGRGALLAATFDQASLLAAGDSYAEARESLIEARRQLKQAHSELAEQLGHLALDAGDNAGALAAYQDALGERPEDAALLAGLARALLKLGEPARALKVLESVPAALPERALVATRAHLALDDETAARHTLEAVDLTQLASSNPPAAIANLVEYADLASALGDRERSAEALRRAVELAPTDTELLLTAARQRADAEDWETACEWAMEATALAPHNVAARELLGRALLALNRPGAAIPHFQAALGASALRSTAESDTPLDSSLQHAAGLGLARAALITQQTELACEAAKHVLATAPEGVYAGQAHIVLGEALARLGREDEAFEHFSRASALMPAEPGPWRAMARHHRARHDLGQALAALEAGRQALKLAGSSQLAPLLLDLAEAYLAADRRTEALTALREACAADPRSAATHRQLGLLLRRTGRPQEAVEALRQALALRPGDWRTLYELGLALEDMRRPVEARAAFQQAVLARPDDPAPYFDLGRLTLMLHDKGMPDATPQQALLALNEAVERAPDHAEAHALLAHAQHLAGDAEGALESYQRALHLSPRRTDWSLGLGEVCLQLNRPDVALAALQEAMQHAPHDPRVHLACTRAYLQNQLWAEAAHSAEAALKLDPENVELHTLLAQALSRLGQLGRAAFVWERATRLAPRDAELKIQYARCLLELKRVEDARGVLAQALALAPDAPAVHLAAGQALLEMGETEAAYETLAQAAELAPHDANVQAALGQAALRAGRYEAAHAAYLRAAELEPHQPAHLREAGEALWRMDRPAGAVALWQRAVLLNPNDQLTLAHLGSALLQQGQPADALAALEKAAKQNPDDAGLAREAARAALELGELEKATLHLERALELAPAEAETHALLGRVCEQQGEAERALAFYQQAAQLEPENGRYLAGVAVMLAKLGRRNEAIRQMKQAAALSAEPQVQRQAGDLFLQVNELDAAVQAYRRWVDAQPRNGAAHLALAQALTLVAEQHEREARAGIRPDLTEDRDMRLNNALQQAAALGADPLAVRYWLGRARAATGFPTEGARILRELAVGSLPASLPAAEFYRVLGAALRKAGEFEAARDALQAALDAGEDSMLTYLEIGLTQAALNDARGAVVAFKRAVAAEPGSPLAHAHLAEALFALGDRADAVLVLQRALALGQDVAAWHYRLAKWHQAQHNGQAADGRARALAHLQKAAELEPGSAAYNADLARALLADGDAAAAVPYFRRATEAAPQDAVLWVERGQAHLALHDYTAAQEAFAKAIALAPDNMAAQLGAAKVNLALGNLHVAFNQAENAVRADPESAEALLCLADVQAARGQAAEAEAYYEEAAERAADPAPALLALGRLHLAQGKAAAAIDALQRAVRANPNWDEAVSTLGDAYAAVGNSAMATQAYREAHRLAPRAPQHLLKLGRTLRLQGQLDQAIAHLLQARDLAPQSDETLREIGLVFEQRRQFDRALEMYRLAIKAGPRCAANYIRAGVALKNLKDYAGSVSALEQAVALDPNNLEATKQLA